MKSIKSLKQQFLLSLFTLAIFCSTSVFSQSTKLTDPEIASVAVTANQIDIEYAVIAKERSKDKEILRFAETMSNDHKAVIAQAVALVTKLKVTPKDNPISKSLITEAEKTKKQLVKKSGDAFNKAYINNEVAYHKMVINAIENTLIPSTQNEELKTLLIKVVPALKTHLAHAEMVQKMIK